ncbi:MAG: hypothetical protein HONBIEJF_00953 [Fimbriimonadaceae bacterium]|nr:hypothetical protein [Fimbriimonadaceae bacterium]
MRHPVAGYFALTFLISWGLVFLTVGPGGFPGTEADFYAKIVPVVAAMLLGPSIAGLSATVLAGGGEALKAYAARLRIWRVGWEWYAYALLIAPATLLTVLLFLTRISDVYLPGLATAPNTVQHVVLGLLTGAAAGVFEELGWTGFATPYLRKRLSTYATGVVLGVIWGAWHLLTSWWGSGPTAGGVSMPIYLIAVCFSFLPPYRILMVRMHERVPSIPLAMLMHASLTASVRLFDPIGLSGTDMLVYTLSVGGALWLVVGAMAIVGHRPQQSKSAERAVDDGRIPA